MILLDTHALVFDAVASERLTKKAQRAIARAFDAGTLACSDISLWEVALLATKGRLHLGVDVESFLSDVLSARGIAVLGITPRIAAISASPQFAHGDPADRIIGATALAYEAVLVTADDKLRGIEGLSTIW